MDLFSTYPALLDGSRGWEECVTRVTHQSTTIRVAHVLLQNSANSEPEHENFSTHCLCWGSNLQPSARQRTGLIARPGPTSPSKPRGYQSGECYGKAEPMSNDSVPRQHATPHGCVCGWCLKGEFLGWAICLLVCENMPGCKWGPLAVSVRYKDNPGPCHLHHNPSVSENPPWSPKRQNGPIQACKRGDV